MNVDELSAWSNKMIVDQAEKLRLMVRDSRKTARVLTVASGKGGVGKTNVAANLAICMAASGKEVLLLDADLGLANLDIVLNVKARYTLAHVISGQRSLEEVILKGPGGIRLICGASGLTQMADLNEFQRQRLLQEMTKLEHQFDVIVIDTGAGISRNVLSFCDAADHTVVVTTPEPTSITDAYAVIKCLSKNRSGMKLSLLVNMALSRQEAKNVYQRIAGVAQKFLSVIVYEAGYILRDDHVIEAVKQREPVVLAYPRCQAGHCYLALAGKLNRAAEVTAEQNGFFRKVVNWFF
jgi:flagellar biosynthesis protein FlhG